LSLPPLYVLAPSLKTSATPSPDAKFNARYEVVHPQATAFRALVELVDKASNPLFFSIAHSSLSRVTVDAVLLSFPSQFYRFHEITQVYGTTIKALIHQMFGDGMMSAIDFEMEIEKGAKSVSSISALLERRDCSETTP
jgi:cyanate lyase